jgi:uncharacterized protein (DUF1800 family)
MGARWAWAAASRQYYELARILTGWTVNLRNGEGFFRFYQSGCTTKTTRLLGGIAPTRSSRGEDHRFHSTPAATARRVSERRLFFVNRPPAAWSA